MRDSQGSRIRELERRLANLIRVGTIGTVNADATPPTATVVLGAITTSPRPWLTRRAGPSSDADWWAPAPGEQVILLSPSGDFNQGTILPAIYQTACPAPGSAVTQQIIKWADGSTLTYDSSAHTWTLNVAEGGSISLTAAGAMSLVATGQLTLQGSQINLNGPVVANGTVTADTDVIGGGKSLKTHVHSGVQSGSGETGPPV